MFSIPYFLTGICLFCSLIHGCRDSYSDLNTLLREHPATRAENYDRKLKNRSLADKIQPASKLSIAYATDLNQLDGFPEKPRTASLSSDIQKSFLDSYDNIDSKLHLAADHSLYSVEFCQDLGSSALTLHIYDNSGKSVGGVILIDIDRIARPGNDWITYRERTAFDGENADLDYTIFSPEQNDSAHALLYLFVHELAHVHAEHTQRLPSLQEAYGTEKEEFVKKNMFLSQSWKNPVTSKYDDRIPFRKEISFYATSPSLKAEDAPLVYEALGKTNFVSLYAMIDPWEDFAETSAYFFLCKEDCRITTGDSTATPYRQRPGMKEKLAVLSQMWN